MFQFDDVIMITSINVDLLSNVYCNIHPRTVQQQVLMNFIRNICLEITLLKSLPHIPGANELIQPEQSKGNPCTYFIKYAVDRYISWKLNVQTTQKDVPCVISTLTG